MRIHHPLTGIAQRPVMRAGGMKIHFAEKRIHHIVGGKTPASQRGAAVAAVLGRIQLPGNVSKINSCGDIRTLHKKNLSVKLVQKTGNTIAYPDGKANAGSQKKSTASRRKQCCIVQ
jgi:hypothetical protein